MAQDPVGIAHGGLHGSAVPAESLRELHRTDRITLHQAGEHLAIPVAEGGNLQHAGIASAGQGCIGNLVRPQSVAHQFRLQLATAGDCGCARR